MLGWTRLQDRNGSNVQQEHMARELACLIALVQVSVDLARIVPPAPRRVCFVQQEDMEALPVSPMTLALVPAILASSAPLDRRVRTPWSADMRMSSVLEVLRSRGLSAMVTILWEALQPRGQARSCASLATTVSKELS